MARLARNRFIRIANSLGAACRVAAACCRSREFRSLGALSCRSRPLSHYIEEFPIETPDERHAFEHASLNVVNLPGVTIARTVYQPGWRWSTDVKPVVGTEACQAAHTGYIISGRLHARMDDGREYDFGPGDAHVVSAGHDAWVEGDEPCVALDLAFTGRALAGHVGRCPCDALRTT